MSVMRVWWWRDETASFPRLCAEGSVRSRGQGGRRGTALAPGLIAIRMATLAALVCPHAAFASAGGDVDPFVYRLTVFVIAIFVGYYVVWSVTPALHTPLVGVSLASEGSMLAKIFGFLALTMASVNIFGGFLVTQRMLGMYKKRDAKK
jgi:NAD(P) transhydrogenase subunit alpha